MNLVQPIRDWNKVVSILKDLREKSYRDYMLFFIAVNTGLRIQDVLDLKVNQCLNKEHLSLIEQKTSKPKLFKLNADVQNEIKAYVKAMKLKDDDYMFPSRQINTGKGEDKEGRGVKESIDRVQAWRILKEVALQHGIENFGCHSTRKTFGYHYYKKTHNIYYLQKIFNHSSQKTTFIYIGIEQEEIDKTLEDFTFKIN